MKRLGRYSGTMPAMAAAVALLAAAMVALVACTRTETVTVEVPVASEPQIIVETVVVERAVEVPGDTVVQTVVVDREVVVTPTPRPRGEVSREDTLVVTGFGAGATQWDDPENMNPYSLGGLGRVRGILNKTIYEFLYLYNHNDGQVIPWLAESSQVDDDFMGVNVTLRDGIEWSDGMPFTSTDVKFTIDLLLSNDEMVFAGDIQ